MKKGNSWRPEGWENPYTVNPQLKDYPKNAFEQGADAMLKAISEEIEKELNGREEDMIADIDYKEGWLDCRHWILALLKQK